MKSNKGFTLIEMAVVLAIIAVLAAIMTPIVTGYIDQARLARANEDTSRISQAMLLHLRDTGRFPVWDTTGTGNGGLSTGTTTAKNCMVSGASAVIPTDLSAGTTWTSTVLCTTATNIGLIRNYLNVNTLNMTTAIGSNGQVTYRGPYLDGLDSNDPWGNPYVVNTKYLPVSGTNANFWAFVISAGPDASLNTLGQQAKTSPYVTAGDDITSLIH